MSINGIRNNGQPIPAGEGSNPAEPRTVTRIQSTERVSTQAGEVVSTQLSNASAGEIPENPEVLEDQLRRMEVLYDQLGQLDTPEARRLQQEMASLIEKHREILESDLDQDGAIDLNDPDIDGDGISNAGEAALHTDPRNTDTDFDGISDDWEIRGYNDARQRGDSRTAGRFNPLYADADQDGFMDPQQISQEVRDRLGLSTVSTASEGESTGVNIQSPGEEEPPVPPQWGDPSSESIEIDLNGTGADRSLASGNEDIVIRASGGEVEIRQIGDTLVIKNGSQKIEVKNDRRIFIEGEVKVRTINFDADSKMNTDSVQNVTSGIHFGDGVTVENVSSPFADGRSPDQGGERTVRGVFEQRFTVTAPEGGNPLTVNLKASHDGQELTQWNVRQHGPSAVLEGKNRAGEVIYRLILEGGMDLVNDQKLTIQLDRAAKVESSLRANFRGSSGDDYFDVEAGSTVDAGDGSDFVMTHGNTSYESTIYLGAGEDIYRGTAGRDTVYGGGDRDVIDVGKGPTFVDAGGGG